MIYTYLNINIKHTHIYMNNIYHLIHIRASYIYIYILTILFFVD
jgi:hypothetical protein